MTLYYCINDVLDKIEKVSEQETRLQKLISITSSPPENHPYPEDVFVLSSSPKMLDLQETDSAYQLAQLLEDVPLYNVNIELILDQALTERHHNTVVAQALNIAFGNQPLPNTLKTEAQDSEDFSSSLRHPMLGHLDKTELCNLYIKFLQSLHREQDNYAFEKNILGKHTDRFLERFDGYASGKDGKVKAQILIAFGHRQDHDPSMPVETHVQNGEKNARKMGIDEPHELIWAWLEADHYQMRRCRDIDRIMNLERLPKIPNWVRTDVFSCLEKEAMKQIFAGTLRTKDPELSVLETTPDLQHAIRINADGEVDRTLQQLLAQTLTQGSGYNGGAAKFAETAQKRAIQAQKSQLGS